MRKPFSETNLRSVKKALRRAFYRVTSKPQTHFILSSRPLLDKETHVLIRLLLAHVGLLLFFHFLL